MVLFMELVGVIETIIQVLGLLLGEVTALVQISVPEELLNWRASR